MHILHVSNSYGGTEVYTQLIRALDKLGVKQTVFVPLNPNNRNRKGNYLVRFTVPGSSIIYSTKLEQYHRYLYGLKINTIVKEVEKQVEIKNIDLIHAGLFCTDGAVAYELSKNHNLPYIVAVRNTDVNFYYKKMSWRRKYFQSILASSKKIIFISHQYKKSFLELLSSKVVGLNEKSIVLPNGINSFYLENRVQKQKDIHSPVKIIYAGAINRGKNILETLKAIETLVEKGYLINYKVIGKGLKFRRVDKDYQEKICSFAAGKKWVQVLNSLPKEELRNEFNENDIFVMPSTPETFGIVYLEALSQGLPIIYANGQGFDGYYEDRNIGFGVNPKNPQEIAEKIENIIKNYDQISSNVIKLDLFNDFSWDKISENYLKLYKNLLNENSVINFS